VNRVEALAAALNDAARSESDRETALRALENIASTGVDTTEREAATRVLSALRPVSEQGQQDSELESWLVPDTKRTSDELIADRASLSPASKQLLDDLSDCRLLPPSTNWSAVAARMKALLLRTGSETVRRAAREAFSTTVFCQHEKEIVAHDTPDARRTAHRAFLAAEGVEQ
jgi:hypothetical protein